MTGIANLENISIVLQRPRYPENIGAVVRAGHNMGITNLIVVEPLNYDKTKILRMATHATADAVDRIKIFDNLKEALSPFSYIVGTTARMGKHRQNFFTPSNIAEKIISLSPNNRIALLFGPEDRGLTNEDLQFCHSFVNIPTADFSSINLAQAVMVICHEIFSAQKQTHDAFMPKLANRHELDGMYDQLTEILTRISFLNPQNPDYWMNNIRSFFSRLQLRAKEVKIIRGICRQINWYGEKRFRDIQMNETTELLTRTLCDLQPKIPTNGAYLYCQTKDNQKATFQAAQFLLNNSCTSKILILHTKAKSGYSGFAEWKHQLQQLGLPEEQIEGVKIKKTSELNTLIESEALIRFAKQQRYCSLFVVAPPFQQLRAFMTAVTVSIREYPELLIYSYPSAAMPWEEEVVHSQGTLKAKRRELIQKELQRIEKYQDKGDLALFEQVLNYLNKREKAF